jgi:hypothetical protein
MEEDGLPNRVVAVRPVSELLALADPPALDRDKLRAMALVTPGDDGPPEDPELSWRKEPGPTYTDERAEEALKNRYTFFPDSISRTLPRILADKRCRDLIAELRSEKMLDWQILMLLSSMIISWQDFKLHGAPREPEDFAAASRRMNERARRSEAEADPQFDLAFLTREELERRKMMQWVGVLKAWGLTTHRQTPDGLAIKRLLDERYNNSTDDVAHADPFPGI